MRSFCGTKPKINELNDLYRRKKSNNRFWNTFNKTRVSTFVATLDLHLKQDTVEVDWWDYFCDYKMNTIAYPA
jgi:hypothetical protein